MFKFVLQLAPISLSDATTSHKQQVAGTVKLMLVQTEKLPNTPLGPVSGHGVSNFLTGDHTEAQAGIICFA